MMRMIEVLEKAMVEALVEEVGLRTTLNVLEKAKKLDANEHPVEMNPDFIGMESYAKVYAEETKNERSN